MDLRKEESKNAVREEETKRRFQIVKLEERIAPHHRLGHDRGNSGCKGPHCG